MLDGGQQAHGAAGGILFGKAARFGFDGLVELARKQNRGRIVDIADDQGRREGEKGEKQHRQAKGGGADEFS